MCCHHNSLVHLISNASMPPAKNAEKLCRSQQDVPSSQKSA